MLLEAGPRLGGRAMDSRSFRAAARSRLRLVPFRGTQLLDRDRRGRGYSDRPQHRRNGAINIAISDSRRRSGSKPARRLRPGCTGSKIHHRPAIAQPMRWLPACEWNDYIRTIVGFISGGKSGAALDSRLPRVRRSLIGQQLARAVRLWIAGGQQFSFAGAASPCDSRGVDRAGSEVESRSSRRQGAVRARAVILTVSTAVLAGDALKPSCRARALARGREPPAAGPQRKAVLRDCG